MSLTYASVTILHVLMFSVIYRLLDDRSRFQIKSSWRLSQPPPPPPYSCFTQCLILSLIFVTWVMAFVIPNDSRNKSAVMRSHWALLFFFSFSEITLRSSIQSTSSWVSGFAPGPELQWTSVKQINSFLLEDLPLAKMDGMFFWACLLLSQYPRLIISWLTGAHILLYLMTALAYLLI